MKLIVVNNKDNLKKLIKEYINFERRAGRREFFFYMLLLFGLVYIGKIFQNDPIVSNIFDFFIFCMLLPDLAVTSRRLHDLNFSGWWQLLFIFCGWSKILVWNIYLWIPHAQILLIPLLLIKGTSGTNKYGEEPSYD